MKKIAIYRNQLFKNSESFITNQADGINNYEVVYFGRKLLGDSDGRNFFSLNNNGGIIDKFSESLNAVALSTLPFNKFPFVDLIHAHFAIDAMYALQLSKKRNIPLITTLHGFDVTVDKMKFLKSMSPSKVNYILRGGLLKREGNVFLCVSDFIKKQAILAGFPENKLLVHYMGINNTDYDLGNDVKKHRYFIHVARLVEKKGTLNIISAIKSISNRLNGYKVLIVGNGPLYLDIKNKIQALGLEKHIEMLGEVKHSEVMNLIASSSVMLAPSITAKSGDSEGLPTVILEAAAKGVPTIGTYHAGIPEVIINEKTGLLVPENDIDALAEKILFFINNESEISKYGNSAREHVRANFDSKKQTELLELIYSKEIG